MSDDLILNISKLYDFEEIPAEPKSSNVWMIEHNVAVWFSTYDNKWRLMLMSMNEHTRRSGESFDSLKDIEDFCKSGKVPTWVKGSIVKND